jgi:hypothetical protein
MAHVSFRKFGFTVLIGLLAGLLLAAPAAAAPADGNGNKFVAAFEFTDAIDCGETTIWVDVAGWAQFREFKGKGNRNIDMGVFHVSLTYYSDAGETFTHLDVGPDRAYVDRNGDLIFTITGRPGNAGGGGFALSGHMVINDTTGEVTWHGRTSPDADTAACLALT